MANMPENDIEIAKLLCETEWSRVLQRCFKELMQGPLGGSAQRLLCSLDAIMNSHIVQF